MEDALAAGGEWQPGVGIEEAARCRAVVGHADVGMTGDGGDSAAVEAPAESCLAILLKVGGLRLRDGAGLDGALRVAAARGADVLALLGGRGA